VVGTVIPKELTALKAVLGPLMVVTRVVEGLGHGAMVFPRAQEHLTLLRAMGGLVLWRGNTVHLIARDHLLMVTIVTKAGGLMGLAS